MYLLTAFRGEIPAPAMIISPGECATRPHRTGRVPHPSGDAIPGIRTLIRFSPLTLAEQLRRTGQTAAEARPSVRLQLLPDAMTILLSGMFRFAWR